MPSLKRPNAPDRLPSSDFGNLFGRPRAVRGSDLTSANSSLSPLSTPNNYISTQRRALRSSEGGNAYPATTSPLASPPLAIVRQRPKLERRSYYSDVVVVSPDKTNNTFSSSKKVPLIIEGDPVLVKKRTVSGSSSAKSRARRLLGLPGIRITPEPGSEQPSSKARSGFKWKHEFSGRWFEIRLGRKGQSAEHSVQASGEATPMPLSHRSSMHLPLTQAPTVHDPEGGDRSPRVASNQRLLLPGSQSPLQSATLTPREGLYCRTRRALGIKHDPVNPTDPSEPRERTSTDTLLDRVSSTLRFLPKREIPSPSSTTSSSNLSIAAPREKRMMHRHQHSTSTNPSTSSSIRRMMMGKPPIPTPEPEAMYTASDDNKYMVVDLTDGKSNGGVTFLPSEARRVHTPPLPSADATATSPGGKAVRGFFFDYSAPALPERPTPLAGHASNVNVSAGGGSGGSGGGASGGAQQQRRRDSDWYRVKMNAIIDAEDSTVMSMEELAVSVPEHLPNSPLCPRHPKHKSGGRGECPFHGRNPTALLAKGMGKEGKGLSPQVSPGEHWW